MENEQEYNQETASQDLYRIGITHGDVNGISYEIILKALSDPRLTELFTPVIYGSSKVASYHKKALDTGNIHFNLVRSAEQAEPGKVNMVNIYSGEIKIDLGQPTRIAGEVAYLALESATADLGGGHLQALVTAPISKQNIQSSKFPFPGHTEYLAKKFGVDDSLMLMVNNDFRIGVITGHIPLREVPAAISKELILHKLWIFNRSLVRDFGIRKPRIAVLGLNPHAGDQGVLGEEEQQVVVPAIKTAFDEGILAFGPYPADGFFGSASFRDFDGILAMYHDQGLIPFKALSFKSGVNFTAGLPVVRTSPAHGTAYDIAGKNLASPDAFREAIYLAIDVVRNRAVYDEYSADPLRSSVLEEDSDADRNALRDLSDNHDESDL
jgi:4-hydroxythreonine-4-phosphate dehydrogenase